MHRTGPCSKRRGCRQNLGADSRPDLAQPLDETATTNETAAQEQNTLLAKLYQYAISSRDCQTWMGRRVSYNSTEMKKLFLISILTLPCLAGELKLGKPFSTSCSRAAQ
jgi:hypothetical protein